MANAKNSEEPKAPEPLTIDQLKVMAFDLIAQRDQIVNQLQMVLNEIAKRQNVQ
jgi:hypothetical protein